MFKTELNAATLTKALVPFLNKLHSDRSNIVLSQFRHGWTLGFDVCSRAVNTALTSADVNSRASTVAARLLSDLED